MRSDISVFLGLLPGPFLIVCQRRIAFDRRFLQISPDETHSGRERAHAAASSRWVVGALMFSRHPGELFCRRPDAAAGLRRQKPAQAESN